MLQLAQRTSAPSSTSVSISTAVWIVMCSEPEMRAPASGFFGPNSARSARRPGISCSARWISLRPKSASDRSATRKSLAVSTRGAVVVVIGVSPSGTRPPEWRPTAIEEIGPEPWVTAIQGPTGPESVGAQVPLRTAHGQDGL